MLLQELLADKKLILASNSPRRRQLLGGLDIGYEVWTSTSDNESYPKDLTPDQIPVFLAKQKATHFMDRIKPEHIIITCDTIVYCNNLVLGKPTDAENAKHILQMLSGSMHTVITGVALTSTEKQATFSAKTRVYFKPLADEEIEYYVSSYKPFDKAGAYGIQEWIGYVGIEQIEGSYFNVMGLPVQKLHGELIKFMAG